MCFVVMCGLPSSGKSVVADLLLKYQPQANLIRPSDWMPENIEALSPDAERDYRLECWKLAIEKTEEILAEITPDNCLILDCGNSKFRTLSHIITEAQRRDHTVLLVFVDCKLAVCMARAPKIPKSVFEEYVGHLKDSLPKYKKACDRFHVVHNNGTLEQLGDMVREIRCQNT